MDAQIGFCFNKNNINQPSERLVPSGSAGGGTATKIIVIGAERQEEEEQLLTWDNEPAGKKCLEWTLNCVAKIEWNRVLALDSRFLNNSREMDNFAVFLN